MRIGEILLSHAWCGEDDLALALVEQRLAGRRTCSLLIVRGALEPDNAARALGEQFGCAAALQKHLEHRDRALAKLLPANVARAHHALPIGRLRDGELIICVRDPKPEMQAMFERIVQKPVVIAVASAHSLEPIIEMTYAHAVTQDFAMRFAPKNPPPPPTESLAAGTATGVVEEVEVDLESAAHAIPEALQLVDLDDAGVSRDFTQVGVTGSTRQPTLPPMNTTRTPTKKP